MRDYIDDNALTWLREFGADGLRWDSTVNVRSFGGGRPLKDGGELLRKANDDYRNTDPRQPRKLSIAEDLQGSVDLTAPTDRGGFGFNTQWDDSLWLTLRRATLAPDDEGRDVAAVRAAVAGRVGDDPFARVIYTENHDKVGHPTEPVDGRPQTRLPAVIDPGDPESVYARRRSTLAAAVLLTSPGVPMIFQGQEMLETRAFDFATATPVRWERADAFKGIVAAYRDLIGLGRDPGGKTAGLSSPRVNVYHADARGKTLAYHRFGRGGPGDDVVVVVNPANRRRDALNVGFPRGGRWVVRFNSGSAVYDREFRDGEGPDTTALPGPKEGLGFDADVGVGPSVTVILSQD